MSKQHSKQVILYRKSWHTKTWAQLINLIEVVFTSLNTKIVGRNSLDILADHSARGKMNNFSLSNTEIQIWHLQNTYMILDIHLALWNVSCILYMLSRKDNV
jgi:hypothetical protein